MVQQVLKNDGTQDTELRVGPLIFFKASLKATYTAGLHALATRSPG